MRVVDGDGESLTEYFYADGKQYTRFSSGDGDDT